MRPVRHMDRDLHERIDAVLVNDLVAIGVLESGKLLGRDDLRRCQK